MKTHSEAMLMVPITQHDHSKENPEALVTLVEYGDCECPYCGRAYRILKEVMRSHGDYVKFVFRNFPLASVHPHAQLASEAAEAAGAQGKFWEMHDALFEHQDAMEMENILEYATAIGLDLQRFSRDLLDHNYSTKVRQDFLSGVQSGVNGTPTFFIGGIRYDGPYDYSSLYAILGQAIDLAREEQLRS